MPRRTSPQRQATWIALLVVVAVAGLGLTDVRLVDESGSLAPGRPPAPPTFSRFKVWAWNTSSNSNRAFTNISIGPVNAPVRLANLLFGIDSAASSPPNSSWEATVVSEGFA